MSIAVRVGGLILGFCVLVSATFAVMTYLQKQSLQGKNQSLQSQISDDESKLADSASKTKSLQDQVDQLNGKVTQAQQDKSQVQSLYDELKHKSDDLQAQLTQANSDRDDWKNRVETMRHERDDLMEKIKNQPSKIVYRYKIRKVIVHDGAVSDNSSATPAPTASGDTSAAQGDEYWAGVLRQKAALQVELEKEKASVDQAALQVVDLKKQNSDLELEVKEVNNEKDEIIQKIKYGQDLADNLSIDLARSRNDQKAVNDRADRLKEENVELQSQIRDLSSTKLELEKTVSRLSDDKDAMQKKLIETESVIQSRIDDIWKIKEGLDKKLAENDSTTPSTTTSSSAAGMELPPIIVNSPQQGSAQQAPASSPPAASAPVGKTQGTIISINETNNFVIVDFGQENSSVYVGNVLKVYRNAQQVATLEVIQVRREICAADIKDKTADIKVGDVVKII